VVLTSDRFYTLIFNIGGVWILFEVVLGYIVAKVVMEQFVGHKLIFEGTNDVRHPVLWTWYSVYLLLVNLVRGLLAGIIRMVMLILLMLFQIGTMDRSTFPEGYESQDSAFVAFLSTLQFHHK
jgi:hypothetical protein